jgi:hypothetical protein
MHQEHHLLAADEFFEKNSGWLALQGVQGSQGHERH